MPRYINVHHIIIVYIIYYIYIPSWELTAIPSQNTFESIKTHQKGNIHRKPCTWVKKSDFLVTAASLLQGWPPTTYKWSYNQYKWPYKWVTGVITPISGVITLLITGRGPPGRCTVCQLRRSFCWFTDHWSAEKSL